MKNESIQKNLQKASFDTFCKDPNYEILISEGEREMTMRSIADVLKKRARTESRALGKDEPHETGPPHA